MRVLLVDDDNVLRDALARGLRARGLKVDAAPGVIEALELLAHSAYAIVISDEEMTDGHGHAFLAAVAQRQPMCRRALMSGRSVPAGIEVVWERFFSKPEDIDAILTWSTAQMPKGDG